MLINILNSDDSDIPFLNSISRRVRHFPQDVNQEKTINSISVKDEIDKSIENFANLISKSLNDEITKWKNNIEPWELLVESFRGIFHDTWAIKIISVISAGIKSKDETYEEFSDLTDSSKSLCKRVRCARMKSGNIKYWELQIQNSTDITFTLLVLISWATPKTIIQLVKSISTQVNKLSKDEFSTLSLSLRKTTRLSNLNNSQADELAKYLVTNSIGNEVMYLLSYRFSEEKRLNFIYSNLSTVTQNMKDIGDIRLSYLIEKYLKNNQDLTLLKEVKEIYATLTNFEERSYHFYNHRLNEVKELPIEIANSIMTESKKYPRIIASFAERSCRIFANKNIKAVGQIAMNENWFA